MCTQVQSLNLLGWCASSHGSPVGRQLELNILMISRRSLRGFSDYVLNLTYSARKVRFGLARKMLGQIMQSVRWRRCSPKSELGQSKRCFVCSGDVQFS